MRRTKLFRIRAIGAVAWLGWIATGYACLQMTRQTDVLAVRHWAGAVAAGIVCAGLLSAVWVFWSVVDWTMRRRGQLAGAAQTAGVVPRAQPPAPGRPVRPADWPGPVLVPSGGVCDACGAVQAEHFCMAHGCALCAGCVSRYTCPGTGCEWRTRASTAPAPGATVRTSALGGSR